MNGFRHQIFIILASLLPLLGVLGAMVLLWDTYFHPYDLIAFLVLYLIAGLGLSTGYHRLLAHRSFTASRPLRIFFASAGAIGGQGPPLIWTAHHRRHHRIADKPGDPHSPYLDQEPGTGAGLKGLWHAHLGWLFNQNLTSDPVRYCPDLARDKDIRFISRYFVWFVVGGVVLPGLIGLAIGHTVAAFLTAALWGGLVRIFICNHATYAVNSIGHVYGSRRFSTPDESRNNGWLAVLSFGESWHNNHHAFPRSARHGMRWYELDLSAIVIAGLEKAGLAHDVIRIDRGRQEERERAWAELGGGRFARSNPARPLAEAAPVTVGVGDVE
jgi:stearoyl-CoA desaturase (delta-9 desaturase)